MGVRRSTFHGSHCTIASMPDKSTPQRPTARVFLDCEYTGFVAPKLLSLALVLDASCDFYGELDVSQLEREVNEFVEEHVLSQWGMAPCAYSNRASMAQALAAWFTNLVELGATSIEVHYDYHTDMDLLEDLLQEHGLWTALGRILVPTHVGYLYGDDRVEPYMAKLWAHEEVRTGLKAHHALVDARVLRHVFFMVHDGVEQPFEGYQ